MAPSARSGGGATPSTPRSCPRLICPLRLTAATKRTDDEPGRHSGADGDPRLSLYVALQAQRTSGLRFQLLQLVIERRPRRLYVLSELFSLIHSTFSFIVLTVCSGTAFTRRICDCA
jgi:hypothetical protein